jgi:hypothetical protein
MIPSWDLPEYHFKNNNMRTCNLAIILLNLFVFTSNMSSAQEFIWAGGMGGGGAEGGKGVAVDAMGNSFTVGSFVGVVDFDPGPGIFEMVATGSGHIFVTKLDAAGGLIWARHFGGDLTWGNMAHSIALDGYGNVYVTGYFSGTADFDPHDITEYNLTSVLNSEDVFVLKLDASGDFVWVRQFGGNGYDIGFDITVDDAGNVYTTGHFGSSVDFDPGPDEFNLYSMGGMDIFISKLDPSGNFIWAKRIGGTAFDKGASIAVDASGNIHVTGQFVGTVDFDPGITIYEMFAFGGLPDIFILKLDPEGDLLWARQIGGNNGGDVAHALTLDPIGNVYISGAFSGTVDLDPGPNTYFLSSIGTVDLFVAKLDPEGYLIWAGRVGGPGEVLYGTGHTAITLDATGDLYFTGSFQNTRDIDPDPSETFTMVSMGLTDMFITKWSADGNFIWAVQLGGTDWDIAWDIAVDGPGNIYSTGYFYGTTDFDPGPGIFELTSAAFSDIFIHKMGQDINTGSLDLSMDVLSVFPNPVADVLTISGGSAGKEVRVHDVAGMLLHRTLLQNGAARIDVSGLSPGMYFLACDGRVTKIVKQ